MISTSSASRIGSGWPQFDAKRRRLTTHLLQSREPKIDIGTESAQPLPRVLPSHDEFAYRHPPQLLAVEPPRVTPPVCANQQRPDHLLNESGDLVLVGQRTVAVVEPL